MSIREKTRNNKLEYFLKKNLHPSVYNNIRVYEAVILRTGNSLSYKQLVVTGEDLYVTETPPRSVTHLLNAAQITDVILVHDLPEFLHGGVRDQTTHILVRYRLARRSSLVRPPNQGPASCPQPSTSSIDEENEDQEHEYDGPSSYTSAARALAEAAHEAASVCSDPLPSPRLTMGSLSITSTDSLPLIRSRSNGAMSASTCSSHLTLPTNNKLLSSLNGAKSPVRSRSPDADSTFDDRSHTPTIADLLSRGGQIVRSLTPDMLPRSKMPRSLSALETYHRSSPLGLDIPTRSKSVLDKPSTGHPPRRSQSLNLADVTDSKEDENEVHLYTLSTSTLLFHLLHSLWVSSSLIQTQKPRRLRPVFQEVSREHSLDHAFGQLRSELLAASSLEVQFSILQELQHGATKYTTIRRLVWRDPGIINIMYNFIKKYMKLSSNSQRSRNVEEELQLRQDELEVLTLTLETLATCLRGTQRCPFKMRVLKHNKCECLRNLIAEAMQTPEIPAIYKLTCGHWLTDFRELSSRAWLNLPEKELLKLVQEVTHMSTSALYELLGSVSEFSWVCGAQPHNDDVMPSITTLLQHVPVEGWLSHSVPQLLVLLQPERGCEPSDAVLIHQYCSVLATLLHHSPRALQFCSTNYAEELRYYVHESVINCLVGETCPIRPHTLKLVRMIAQLVTSKNSLRAR
ncbi:uncharacterized protein C12orf56-like [Homarus americanus]|uniref:uncharacterized protein C12orf56-like n=1 Tax=Homarus americanus TaxID=6706 RepID=UPI001C43734A|nr:uncharacterized protein C12orf56-like [Homarus americanus]